jgi:hypothetical protein
VGNDCEFYRISINALISNSLLHPYSGTPLCPWIALAKAIILTAMNGQQNNAQVI